MEQDLLHERPRPGGPRPLQAPLSSGPLGVGAASGQGRTSCHMACHTCHMCLSAVPNRHCWLHGGCSGEEGPAAHPASSWHSGPTTATPTGEKWAPLAPATLPPIHQASARYRWPSQVVRRCPLCAGTAIVPGSRAAPPPAAALRQGSAHLSLRLLVRAWSLRTGRPVQGCKAGTGTQTHLAPRTCFSCHTYCPYWGGMPVQVARPTGSVSKRPCPGAQSLLEKMQVV